MELERNAHAECCREIGGLAQPGGGPCEFLEARLPHKIRGNDQCGHSQLLQQCQPPPEMIPVHCTFGAVRQ